MRKLLFATHADRPFVEAKASLNALETRFSDLSRLQDLPDFNSLPSVKESVPYAGKLTVWLVDEESHSLQFLHMYDPGYKVQFATVVENNILVYGADRLEVLDQSFNVIRTIQDSWLAGGHTVFAEGNGHVWVTSAPANAIMRIDLELGQVVERVTLPEQYGLGYALTPEDSVHEHFIPTDLQPTHINSAVPTELGLLVTLWIQGAVGVFDRNRNYREIVRGFRGCHGARYDKEKGLIFFADSPAGILWFVEPHSGEICRRYKVDTGWLHDIDKIEGNVFVVGISDHNALQVIDVDANEVLHEVDCSPFGESVMFVNVCQLDKSWEQFISLPVNIKDEESGSKLIFGVEQIPGMFNQQFWERFEFPNVDCAIQLEAHENLVFEYLLRSKSFNLLPGKYQIRSNVLCYRGGIMIGLLDSVRDSWIFTYTHDSSNKERCYSIEVKEEMEVCLVITANNPNNPISPKVLISDIHFVQEMSVGNDVETDNECKTWTDR